MKQEILKLRQKGLTYNQIVKRIGCSKSTVSYYCGDNQKEKTAQRKKNKRRKQRKWLDSFKKSLACIKCGENRWWVLDFHHRDPKQKDTSVSRLIKSASRERVLKEIKKCDVLCSNCHRDLHYKENNDVLTGRATFSR